MQGCLPDTLQCRADHQALRLRLRFGRADCIHEVLVLRVSQKCVAASIRDFAGTKENVGTPAHRRHRNERVLGNGVARSPGHDDEKRGKGNASMYRPIVLENDRQHGDERNDRKNDRSGKRGRANQKTGENAILLSPKPKRG